MAAFAGLSGVVRGFPGAAGCIKLARMFAAAARPDVAIRAPRAAATARANRTLLALLLLP
jgi:hypothetical protein